VKGPEEVALVCARADGPLCIRGSVYTHVCHHCGVRLMVAPFGQKVIAESAGKAITLCERCARRLPECIEERPEARRDADSGDVVPNAWMLRN
jgi:hypothetical protein